MSQNKISPATLRMMQQQFANAAALLLDVAKELEQAMPDRAEAIFDVMQPNIDGLERLSEDPEAIQKKYQQMKKEGKIK